VVFQNLACATALLPLQASTVLGRWWI